MSYTLRWLIRGSSESEQDDQTRSAQTIAPWTRRSGLATAIIRVWEDIITSCLQSRLLPLSLPTPSNVRAQSRGELVQGRQTEIRLIPTCHSNRCDTEIAAGGFPASIRLIMEKGSWLIKSGVQMFISVAGPVRYMQSQQCWKSISVVDWEDQTRLWTLSVVEDIALRFMSVRFLGVFGHKQN